jgi:DNA replication protein DnaC
MEIEATILENAKKRLIEIDELQISICKNFVSNEINEEKYNKTISDLNKEQKELMEILSVNNKKATVFFEQPKIEEVLKNSPGFCSFCNNPLQRFDLDEKKHAYCCLRSQCQRSVLNFPNVPRWLREWTTFVCKKNSRYLNANPWGLHEVLKPLYQKISNMIEPIEEFPGLLLNGDVGSGKTFFVFSMIRDLLQKEIFVFESDFYYLSESFFFSEMKNEMDSRVSRSWSVLDRAQRAKVLFYDDLGSAIKTIQGDWAKQVIFEIIDHRYNNRMPIFITTNLDKKVIEDTFGLRTADRLNVLFSFSVRMPSQRKPGKI